MPWLEIVWNLEDDDGNAAHVAEHGLTIDDVEHVLQNPHDESVSRSSGRPIRYGFLADGRYVAVVYEEIDDVTVYPITAYEV